MKRPTHAKPLAVAALVGASLVACADDAAEITIGDACPPAGAVGLDVGDVAPDFALSDCDGGRHTLRELCSTQAAFLYTFAATCTTCQAYAASATPNALWDKYGAHGFGMWFIVTANATNGAPDADYCRVVREQFGLTMPVLFDGAGTTAEVLGMPVNSGELVLSRGNRIESKTWGAQGTVEQILEQLFGF